MTTKTLNTIQEVLHALADGHKVKDAHGWEIELTGKYLNAKKHTLDAENIKTSHIELPCTLIEEPKEVILYEWEYFYESLEVGSKSISLSEDSFATSKIISTKKPNYNATKTGRKFKLVDGYPVLIEGE